MEDRQVIQIVEDFRQNVYPIDDDGVDEVLELCRRKMKLSKKPDHYLYFLLPDELRKYCVRLVVNLNGMKGKTVKEIIELCGGMLTAEKKREDYGRTGASAAEKYRSQCGGASETEDLRRWC